MDTLVTTITTDGDKTITGCTVGQLILFLHAQTAQKGTGAFCYIEGVSGSKAGLVKNQHYIIGTTQSDDGFSAGSGCNIFAVVATATSVVVHVGATDGDDSLYVYR